MIMSKSAKKPSISSTRRDFYRKCRVPYVPRDPSEPPDLYVPQAIRETHSYGPRSQKYDEYIELFGDSDDSEKSTASRNKAFNQKNLAKIRKYDLKTLRTIHEKICQSKTPSKPILNCYSAETETKNSLTAKKSAPIKKISFALPDDKCLLDHERMDWKDYHPLEVIHKFMDDLEADYPSICTSGSIGLSVEGRHLKILKISNSNANNVAVWMDAGIHAREWIAPAVNTYIANHISRNFETLPESVTNKDWYFLPVVNPDGYHYSHTTNRMWRKNRANYIGNTCGVDLNRNFGVGWGGRGSSNLPNNSFYRGPHPFSEPESSAMRDVLSNSGIKFQVYITLHSYGQIIIFPYSCTTEMAPDYVHLLEGATAMSKAIYNTNGETYKVGISRDVMYAASGTSNDFAHGGAGIPYCYLIELRSKKHKFKLPKEEIEETGNEILSSVLALMEFVETYSYQNKIDQKVDLLLEKNDSLTGNCSFVNTAKSHLKQCVSYNRRNYSYLKQSDSLVKTQSSYVRLSHFSGERDDSVEESSDPEWPDRIKNKDKPLGKNNFTSDRETGLYEKVEEANDAEWRDCIKNRDKSLEKNTNTSERETGMYKKVEESSDDEGPNCIKNRDKSMEKNMNTSEKETVIYKNFEESSESSLDSSKPDWPYNTKNRDKSVESNINSSEKGTSVYKKYNHCKDSSAPFPLYYDSYTQKPESSKDASDATDSYLNETESLTDREDSYETWNSFYKHKNDFVEKRNHLLQTGATFVAVDSKWYLYFFLRL